MENPHHQDGPSYFSGELDEQVAFNILSEDLAYAMQLHEDVELAEKLEKEEKNRMAAEAGYPSQEEFDGRTAMDIFNRELAYVTQLQEDEALARKLEQEENHPNGKNRSLSRSSAAGRVAFEFVNMFPFGIPQHVIPSSHELQQDQALARALEEEEDGQWFRGRTKFESQSRLYRQDPRPDVNILSTALLEGDIPNDYEALWDLAEQIGEVQSSGLENSELDCLPSQVYTSPQGSEDVKAKKAADEDRHCTICREDFNSGDDLRILPCCHRYHKQCLDIWLQTKAVCPICNLDVKSQLTQTRQQK